MGMIPNTIAPARCRPREALPVRTPRRLLALAASAVLLAACAAGGSTTDADEPTSADGAEETEPVVADDETAAEAADVVEVVVTTTILGDVAQEVLADGGARVEVLMPPGADPHGYQPSAADGVALREADLVVAVGLGLEEALDDTLEAAEEDGVEVVRVAELVDPVEYQFADGHDHGSDDHEHESDDDQGSDDHGDASDDDHAAEGGDHDHEGGLDPHVWLDPVRAAGIAEAIADAYAEAVPDAAATVDAAAQSYGDRMAALDEEITATLAVVPEDRRQLITNHDAFGYFADRYDLEVVATVLPGTSADVDVTAEAFTELVTVLRDSGVPAVFAETTSTDRLATALAGEVPGVEVVELYTGALGEPGSGADTLEGLLRTDAELIAGALG